MLLAEILPALADQLVALVRQKGAPELAAQVRHCASRIVVGAGKSFAPDFTTRSPNLKINTVLAVMDLDAAEGMVYIDTVAQKIVHVEIQNRQDIRRKLLEALP